MHPEKRRQQRKRKRLEQRAQTLTERDAMADSLRALERAGFNISSRYGGAAETFQALGHKRDPWWRRALGWFRR